ncbi:hypothetical protein PSHT_16500 [Puccinia striiformis]|uniref:Uncharacterized protein n=1 Tax=Puccinia striiformis TaxID=27350 RepID=A0A2S4U9P0_9BASI|nr:hypothetical protein PSHT_16500 [Puccinia striiformis]
MSNHHRPRAASSSQDAKGSEPQRIYATGAIEAPEPNIEHSQRVNKSPITIPSNSSDNEEADLWDDSIPDNTVPLVGVIPADGVESFVTKFAKNYKASS